MSVPPLDAAIAAVWTKNLPQTRKRLEVLQRAADDLATSRTIDDDLRAEALDVAHKLAGSLGMFGMHDATEAARSIEHNLQQDGLPQPERLQEQVAALHSALAAHLED